MSSSASYPDLQGKVVVLTGGANGIGAAAVRAFCDQGTQVFFCDRDAKKGEALAAELGANVHFAEVDLCREVQVRRWITGIAKGRFQIDVLVNNAARDPRIAFSEMTVAQWDELFACNLRSCFIAAQQTAKWMRAGASIINLTSITWHTAPSAMTAYVSTKGGLLGFTRTLARELGPRRIRVNAVSPGWIMTERQLKQFVTPAVRKLIRKSQCIPDLIEPEEIARVILFLASSASGAITGQEILADRGWAHS